MPARIRLRRMGRKKKPHYRVVVADGAAPRDGRFVETIGYYKPLSDPARLVLNLERVDHWLGEGASPSGTVKSLISKARKGGDSSVAYGEEDVEQRQAKRAEELAGRRAAEQKAITEAKAAKDAAAAEAKAAAEATRAEAASQTATEEEAAPEAEAEEPAAEADPAPEAEPADEPVAEVETEVEDAAAEPAAEEGSEPTAEAGADAEAVEEEEEKSE